MFSGYQEVTIELVICFCGTSITWGEIRIGGLPLFLVFDVLLCAVICLYAPGFG